MFIFYKRSVHLSQYCKCLKDNIDREETLKGVLLKPTPFRLIVYKFYKNSVIN